jgi:hypothetical protein
VIAAIVLALLGTVIGVAVANSGGGHKGSGKPDPKHSATKAPARHSAGTGGSAGPSPSGGGTDTSPSSSPATSPATSPASPASPSPSGAVPAGFTTVTSDEFHFSVALPAGWHRTGTTLGGSGAIYSADGGFPQVQIDFTSSPGPNAAAAWFAQEFAVSGSSDAYHRLFIKPIGFRGYRTAADWEFLRTAKDGTKTHVLDRGFVVDGKHAYAIMISMPADQWDSATADALRQAVFASFKPVV